MKDAGSPLIRPTVLAASWGLSPACQEVSPLCLQRPHYLCYLFLINSPLSEILCLDILLQLVLRLPRQRCLPVGLRPQVLGETGGSACDVGARLRAGKCGCRHEPGHRGRGTRVPGLVTSLAGEGRLLGGSGTLHPLLGPSEGSGASARHSSPHGRPSSAQRPRTSPAGGTRRSGLRQPRPASTIHLPART